MSVLATVARRGVMAAGWCVVCCSVATAQPAELQVGPTGHFVAKADGLTDDTTVIQAALNAVASGGTVTIQAGRTYLVNLSIGLRPKANTRLRLHGATLRGPAGQGGRFIELTSKNQVTVSGGTFVGSRSAGAPTYGVLIVNSSDVTIEEATFQDLYTDGILIGGNPGGDRISVRNCRVSSSRRSGVYVTSGRHVSIENSVFENTRGEAPEAGVGVQVGGGTAVEQLRVSRCELRGNGVGVSALKGGGTRLAHVSVSDSTIEGNVRTGVVLGQAAHVIVDGNLIAAHPQGVGVLLSAGTVGATVTGNSLANNFRGVQSDGANMVNVSGNTLLGTGPRTGAGTGTNGDGITCGSTGTALVSQCIVSNNVVKASAGNGIRVMRGSYMIVSNNVIHDSGQKGISVLTVDDSQVRGNSVSRSSLEAPRTHDDILIGAAARRNVVTLNQCHQGSTVRASIFVDNTAVATLVSQNSLTGGAGLLNYSTTTSASWDGTSANWNR